MSGELYILHFARLLLLCNCELPHHITIRSIIYAKLSYAMYVRKQLDLVYTVTCSCQKKMRIARCLLEGLHLFNVDTRPPGHISSIEEGNRVGRCPVYDTCIILILKLDTGYISRIAWYKSDDGWNLGWLIVRITHLCIKVMTIYFKTLF